MRKIQNADKVQITMERLFIFSFDLNCNFGLQVPLFTRVVVNCSVSCYFYIVSHEFILEPSENFLNLLIK